MMRKHLDYWHFRRHFIVVTNTQKHFTFQVKTSALPILLPMPVDAQGQVYTWSGVVAVKFEHSAVQFSLGAKKPVLLGIVRSS